jgi:hypothetical protein
MAGIRTLVLLLGTSILPAQAVVADVSSVDVADKIYVSEFEKFTLTINNVLLWCSISENGSASYSPSAAFNDNTVVDLFAQPKTGFIWGHWEGTDADTGSGDPTKQATVTMTSDRAVLACCPFPDNTGC